jgi:peptide deformylase
VPVRKIIALEPEEVSKRTSSLFAPSGTVDGPSDSLEALVMDLLETMHEYDICVGLAAPQIGVQQQVAVINVSPGKEGPDLILINPVVESTSGQRDVKYESCMSLPGWRGQVERRKKVTIRFVDLHGAPQMLSAEGFLARAITHELDHLDGKLYCETPGAKPIEHTDLFEAYLAEQRT